MSRMKRSGAQPAVEKSPLPKKLLKEVIAVYVFFMFAIYPLYYEEKYYNSQTPLAESHTDIDGSN